MFLLTVKMAELMEFFAHNPQIIYQNQTRIKYGPFLTYNSNCKKCDSNISIDLKQKFTNFILNVLNSEEKDFTNFTDVTDVSKIIEIKYALSSISAFTDFILLDKKRLITSSLMYSGKQTFLTSEM